VLQVVVGVVAGGAAGLLGESPEAHPEPGLVPQHGTVPDGREYELGGRLAPGEGTTVLRGQVFSEGLGQ